MYLLKHQTYPKEKGHVMTSLNSLSFFFALFCFSMIQLLQFGFKFLAEIIFLLKMSLKQSYGVYALERHWVLTTLLPSLFIRYAIWKYQIPPSLPTPLFTGRLNSHLLFPFIIFSTEIPTQYFVMVGHFYFNGKISMGSYFSKPLLLKLFL